MPDETLTIPPATPEVEAPAVTPATLTPSMAETGNSTTVMASPENPGVTLPSPDTNSVNPLQNMSSAPAASEATFSSNTLSSPSPADTNINMGEVPTTPIPATGLPPVPTETNTVAPAAQKTRNWKNLWGLIPT